MIREIEGLGRENTQESKKLGFETERDREPGVEEEEEEGGYDNDWSRPENGEITTCSGPVRSYLDRGDSDRHKFHAPGPSKSPWARGLEKTQAGAWQASAV